jgi:hypothetical protein
MKKVLSGVVSICFLTLPLYAQNLESIGKKNPLAITGSASLNQILYAANAAQSRREPYSYFATGNVNFSLYGWSVPLSFSISNQSRNFQQPDHITWHYPPQLSVLADYGDIVYGQFYEPGTFEVTLNAELGGCKDTMTKRITILENSTDPIGGRLGFEDFVKLFELFPNPNDGSFDVGIELAEESDITLSVWSTITSLNVGIVKDRGNSKYLTHVDLRPLSSGTYVLRLDHAKGHESIRFIVH